MRIGIFVLRHVKVILGSFGALFTKLAHNSKMGNRQLNRINIWASGFYVVAIWVLFYLEPGKLILGSFGGLFSQVHDVICVQ